MKDFDKLGSFYLGREYDLSTKKAGDPLLYDSKDLVTHGMCVGMTGSGKTGLCVGLLEEAALDGIPAIVIDPKGDLANLLLTFPELRAEDFRPWVSEDEADKKGVSLDDFRQRAGGDVEARPGRLGYRAGTHPAPERRGRLCHLHPGFDRRPPGEHPEVLRRACPGHPRRRGSAARPHQHCRPRASSDWWG